MSTTISNKKRGLDHLVNHIFEEGEYVWYPEHKCVMIVLQTDSDCLGGPWDTIITHPDNSGNAMITSKFNIEKLPADHPLYGKFESWID